MEESTQLFIKLDDLHNNDAELNMDFRKLELVILR